MGGKRLLFQQGKAAMTLDATVNGAFNEDPAVSTVAGKVGYAPVPVQTDKPKGGSSSLAVFDLHVASDSQQQDAAWLFISWATSKHSRSIRWILTRTPASPRLPPMNSEVFNKRYGAFKEGYACLARQWQSAVYPDRSTGKRAGEQCRDRRVQSACRDDQRCRRLKEANALNNAALSR